MVLVTDKTPEARILVVDDEPTIVELLSVSLRFQGFEVATASSGAQGLDVARTFRPDAIVLDVMMPGMDGFGLLRRLRADGVDAPVLFLTAKDSLDDKISGLTLGADDYVTKPFGMDEFLARLRAAVRRGAAAADVDEPVVVTESFTVDLAAKRVVKDGSEVHLTPTEWGMLEMLVRNRGKLVGRKELLKEVWGPAYATETHYLRVYLAQLRRKLEDDPAHPKHLLTEAGMGYRFQE